jgi:hypothetical protein
MNFVRRGAINRSDNSTKPIVWGSGFIGPSSMDFLSRVDVRMVRGPISAAIAELVHRKFGDPGVLASDIFPARPKNIGIGIVPHHSQIESKKIKDYLRANPQVTLIDVRKSPKEVCEEISACDVVFSSSLHGLVVADSYGIPNYWFESSSLHEYSRFKFLDYGVSVGRSLVSPMSLHDISSVAKRSVGSELPYKCHLDKSREAVKSTFPYELSVARAPE